MHVQDFVIPLNREELLLKPSNPGQFYVEKEFSSNEIQEKLEVAKTAFKEEGTDFIISHFSTLFSLLQKFKHCSHLTREKEWKVIKGAFSLLLKNLQLLFEDFSSLGFENQKKLCNVTKMIVYILLESMKSNQNIHVGQNSNFLDGKTKKKQIKVSGEEWDWNSEKLEVFKDIYAFLQLPFKLLWEPPVVEEEFINMIANFCYICLEDPGISSSNAKSLKEAIFQIFGILIQNYLHGLSFCVKTVQLLKMKDHLVNVLAQGIIYLYEVCNCTNIVREIAREVADTDGDQLAADTGGTRNINLFLLQLAEAIPGALIPAIDFLISHLHGDSYSMRICVVGVLGEIILNVLTKEDLDENMKKMRDDYLDCLEEHIYDVNAFVRTKVLNTWQKLCIGKAIPISRLNGLLEMTIGRLNDKSTNVKKQAVHLIKDLLEGNPFCAELDISEIENQLREEKKKLESIEKSCYSVEFDLEWKKLQKNLQTLLGDLNEESDFDLEDIQKLNVEELIETVYECLRLENLRKAIGISLKFKSEFCEIFNIQEDCLSSEIIIEFLQKVYLKKKNNLLNLPDELRENIEKHNNAIQYLESALEFSKLIDRALPIILTFFDSNAITDVLEAIHFFSAAYLFGFKKALDGIRKMLHLIFSKEDSIKLAVSSAYQDIYFQSTGSERQQSIATVNNLSQLILKLNYIQLNALEEVVKHWMKTEVINQSHLQVMFERFSMKFSNTDVSQSWASLVLIRMIGAQEHKIIKNNLSVLLNEGLKKYGLKNFSMVKETCKALQHLLPTSEPGKFCDQTLRYSEDHEMFKILFNLLKTGIWKLDDLYYIPMAEEAINLVFVTCARPDDFCKNLIVQIHRDIINDKRPLERKNLPHGNVLNHEFSDGSLLKDFNDGSPVDPSNKNFDVEEAEKENQNQLHVHLLTRFISILGQVASNYVLFLEGPVLDEFKLRNQLEYERKLRKLEEKYTSRTSANTGTKGVKDVEIDKTLNESGIENLEFNRGTADDADADEIKLQTEKKIVTGDGFLAKFSPFILTVCKNPGKYNNKALQNAALLTLAKYMQVSSIFCEENLPLLVTICEKSRDFERQENAVIALGALQYRFPNSLEPWTPHIRAMLLNPNPSVRYNSILILTDLIVNEMIKARNYISNLAVCIVDKEIKIARVARHFFREYSQKGNSLYNVLPVLISNLTQGDISLPAEDFKIVMKYVLSLITKEKQSEHLIEKLCQYFEAATTEKQWCELAYCLSLLNYSDRGLRKILDNAKCFLDKLYVAEVYEAFCAIISESGKNPQKDKALIHELDVIIKEHRGKNTLGDCGGAKKPIPASTRKKKMNRKYLPSDSEEEEQESKLNLKKRKNDFCEKRSSEDDDDDAFLSDDHYSRRVVLRSRVIGNNQKDVSEESDESKKKERQKKTKNILKKRTKPKVQEMKNSSEEEESGFEKNENEIISSKPLNSWKKKKNFK